MKYKASSLNSICVISICVQQCILSPSTFLGIFEKNESHNKISICPSHRDGFGIRWRCTTRKTCISPSAWAPHHAKKMKADRGITVLQSQRLYNLTSTVVPVASRKLFGPKGHGGSRARRTFQSLSNISFPKIAGERTFQLFS